jgi:septum formation inhibitor-activating ATPase MinD
VHSIFEINLLIERSRLAMIPTGPVVRVEKITFRQNTVEILGIIPALLSLVQQTPPPSPKEFLKI